MKRWYALVAIILVTLVLSSCTAQAPTPTPAPKPSPTSAATPVPGGTLKIILKSAASTFGIPSKIVGPNRDYTPPMFERLLAVDEGDVIKPRLATSWETSADGKSITFKLRQGVKFHDGTDFNAQAVKFNLDALIPPKPVIIDGIKSVEVVDPYTVRVNLTTENNLILYQLASAYECYMASPTAIQKNGNDWALVNPVGTGPFKFVSFERNIQMKMVKNPDYWEKGLPYLDGIQMDTIADPMTQISIFKAGETNVWYDVSPTIADQVKSSAAVFLSAPANIFTMAFDTKNSKFFADKRVRQAMEYAIDKEGIVNGPGAGLYPTVYQIVGSTSKSYNPDCPPRKYDPAKAKQLLADAGFSSGFSFKIFVPDSIWKEGFVAVQANLKAVGINMDINYITSAMNNEIRGLGKVEAGQAASTTLNIYSNDLFNMDSYWRTDANMYQFIVRPAGINELIDKAKQAKDNASMYKITKEISKLVYDDATVVPLWFNPRICIMDKTVQNGGWFINKDSSNNDFGRSTWLKK